METAAERGPPRRTLLELLAVELAPREGRGVATARMAIGCAVAVMVAMIFHIPLPAYLAYIVFLASREDTSATLTTAVGGFIAANLAILLTLCLFLVDLSEAALRLPIMALVTFLAMYLSRTFVLGPVTFLAGFVLVLLQTVVDDVPSSEALTRVALWVWVVVLVPIVTTLLGEAIAGQSTQILIRRTLVSVLDQVGTALQRGAMPAELADWREQVVALLPLARRVGDVGRGADFVSEQATACVMDVLMLLAVWPEGIPGATREGLAARARAARDAIAAGRAPAPAAALPSPYPMTLPGQEPWPVVVALTQHLERLERLLGASSQGWPPEVSGSTKPSVPRRLFAADALTNRAHLQFALKTTLAVMTVYILYTLLDWPGLRTSVTTCFFVALGSLGETVHKLILRISGALIGGLLAGLCIVFLLPALTDIGQLSVLVGIVAAGCAWIATSSERLSYAGLQIAFAFYLGVLQGYAPATDLTVLRDRVAGILLGNVVITIVFSILWPESAVTRVRAAVAGALRGVAAMLRSTPVMAEEPRLETARQLVAAQKFLLLSGLELDMVSTSSAALAPPAQVAGVTELAGIAVLASGEDLTGALDPAWVSARAQWLTAAAACVERHEPVPPAPPERPSASGGVLARRTQTLLQERIEHVASQLS